MREKEQRSLLSKGVEKQKENKGKECAKSKKVRLKKGSMGEKEAGVGLSVLFCALCPLPDSALPDSTMGQNGLQYLLPSDSDRFLLPSEKYRIPVCHLC